MRQPLVDTTDMTDEQPRRRPLGVMGDARVRRDGDGFALAQLRPTVPEHAVRRHAHEDMHLVLVLAGSYVSEARGMPAICHEPALIFNPPGTEHRDRFRSRDGLFLTLAMPVPAFSRLSAGLPRDDRPRRLEAQAVSAASRWLRELADWDDASPLAIESGLTALLARPARHHCTSGAAHPGLARALARLDDASPDAPRLSDLADLAGLHPVYFARAFRRLTGSAPGDYLRRRRVHRAIPLILRGRPLSLAAAQLGFSDESHLHRCFVRELGLTPGAFRRLALARREVSRVQDGVLRRC